MTKIDKIKCRQYPNLIDGIRYPGGSKAIVHGIHRRYDSTVISIALPQPDTPLLGEWSVT